MCLEHDVEREGRREFLCKLAKSAALLGFGCITPNSDVEAASRPPSLIGNPTSMNRQVERYKIDDLSMLYNRDLSANSWFLKNKWLVEVQDNDHFYITQETHRVPHTRPYVSLFLGRLASQHAEHTGARLKVTSLIRSYEAQRRLRKINAHATAPKRSPHVRGAAIDISYKPMGNAEMQFMREQLTALERQGCIEATEEIGQQAFHIMVYKNYPKYVMEKLKMDNSQFSQFYEESTGGVIY